MIGSSWAILLALQSRKVFWEMIAFLGSSWNFRFANILLFSKNHLRSLKGKDVRGSIGIKLLAHNRSL
jgi:predicted MPP superfamily phosphohydrolase